MKINPEKSGFNEIKKSRQKNGGKLQLVWVNVSGYSEPLSDCLSIVDRSQRFYSNGKGPPGI